MWGAGQFYCGEYWKGSLFVFGDLVYKGLLVGLVLKFNNKYSSGASDPVRWAEFSAADKGLVIGYVVTWLGLSLWSVSDAIDSCPSLKPLHTLRRGLSLEIVPGGGGSRIPPRVENAFSEGLSDGRTLYLLLPVLLSFTASLYPLSLEPPVIKQKGEWLKADLRTDGKFALRIIGAIDDGIRINFICEYRLLRKSGFFLSPDKVLLEKSASWSVTQNLLEGSYIVRSADGRSFVYRTRREYLQKIASWKDLDVCRFAELVIGETYYLEYRGLVRSTKCIRRSRSSPCSPAIRPGNARGVIAP
jgi:hypothetical protein